jgi:hypothetical protein
VLADYGTSFFFSCQRSMCGMIKNITPPDLP